MQFNKGKPYHGSEEDSRGRLTGTTDTDHFYFFCPRCQDRHIMRILEYGVHLEGPGGQFYPDERPRQPQDFILVFKLFCPKCKLTDFVKVGNVGWQGRQLPMPYGSN